MDAVLDTFRPSTLGWLRGTLAGWGTILLALAGVVLTLMSYGTYWLGLTAVALLIILWRWFENMAAKYEITEERLIVRRGIINKSIDEVELYRIKDVRLDFTLINQVAGIGRVCIASSDETTRGGDLVMDSSLSDSPAALAPTGGRSSSSSDLISVPQRSRFRISAGPEGTSTARCCLVAITTLARPTLPVLTSTSRSSA